MSSDFRKFLYAPSLNYFSVSLCSRDSVVWCIQCSVFEARKFQRGFSSFSQQKCNEMPSSVFSLFDSEKPNKYSFSSKFLLAIHPDPTCENTRNCTLIPQASAYECFVCVVLFSAKGLSILSFSHL